jgi:hypothetical protein
VDIRVFTIHQHTNFHMSSFKGSLVITAKQKDTYNMCSDIYILLCILQKNYINNISIFFKIYWNTTFQDIILHSSYFIRWCNYLLHIIDHFKLEYMKVDYRVASSSNHFKTKLVGQTHRYRDGQTDMIIQ